MMRSQARALQFPRVFAMLYFKCLQCDKITPIPDETASAAPTCKVCGSTLVQLKPAQKAPPSKSKEDPSAARGSVSDTEQDRDEVELVAEEPKPKMKPKKKKPESESDDDDDDEELKPKSKKKRSKKAKRDDDEDRPQKMYSDDEGENVLGPRKQVFTPGIDTLRIVAIICGVLAALGLLSCILSTVTKMPDSAIPFAIVAFVGGMGGLFWSMKSLTFQVVVHAGGIVHSHRGSSKIIPWEEIVRVTEGITADNQKVGQKGITDAYLIELTDHTRISYTNKIIKDVKKLGKIIIEKTSAAIFPQVRVKYDRGDMYDFGRLGINHSGLHYRKQVLKWKEIQGLKITDGYLTVNRQGKWVRWHDIEASAIPNLEVFLTFANEVVLSHAE